MNVQDIVAESQSINDEATSLVNDLTTIATKAQDLIARANKLTIDLGTFASALPTPVSTDIEVDIVKSDGSKEEFVKPAN